MQMASTAKYPFPRRIVHSFRAFRPSAVATAFALLAVAACSDSPTKGGNNGTPAAISISSGDNQVGMPGTPLAAPIAARVTNAQGNPIAGNAVAFTVTRGDGTVASATVSTDNDGVAQTSWTLGSGTVRQEVTASAGSAKRIAIATVDTTRSLFLLPARDTVSAGDTIWLSLISGTTGLGGDVRGAVQETIVNGTPTAARLASILYTGGEFFDYTGNSGTLNLMTAGPTNIAARQRYMQVGYVATSGSKTIKFTHSAAGFVSARTFNDLLGRVSVVGASVYVR